MQREDKMIVTLNISVWTASAKDVKIAQDAADKAGARVEDVSARKKLLPGITELEDIQKKAGAIRTEHYKKTVMWSENNERILLNTGVLAHKEWIGNERREFFALVDRFLNRYPSLVEQIQFRLNGLYDRKLYPPLSKMRDKFKFHVAYYPIPDVEDIRTADGISREHAEAMAAEAARVAEDRLKNATATVWQRMYAVSKTMAEKLAIPIGETGHIFRDSLVGNVRELLDLLPTLNLTKDPELDRMAKAMQLTIAKFEPDRLREDKELRAKVAAKARELSQRMECYLPTDDEGEE